MNGDKMDYYIVIEFEFILLVDMEKLIILVSKWVIFKLVGLLLSVI